jgi:hypothetical protein
MNYFLRDILAHMGVCTATGKIKVELQARFDELKEKWIVESCHISSVDQMISFDSYQEIIRMGWDAVPLLLRELDTPEPNHWFYALRIITGEDPIPKVDRGRIKKMAEHWLQWGRQRSFV